MLVFYIPPCRKTFPELSGNLPCEKKKECEQGVIELTSSRVQILPFTSRPLLTYMRGQNIKCLTLFWKVVQFWEWKSPLLVPEHFVPPPCCYLRAFHSQNCNFPEESFILLSFCYSVGGGISIGCVYEPWSFLYILDIDTISCFVTHILIL